MKTNLKILGLIGISFGMITFAACSGGGESGGQAYTVTATTVNTVSVTTTATSTVTTTSTVTKSDGTTAK